MRTALAALCLIAALASTAGANGRDPYTSTIHWKSGADQNIIVGMTFGLVISHDGGVSFVANRGGEAMFWEQSLSP